MLDGDKLAYAYALHYDFLIFCLVVLFGIRCSLSRYSLGREVNCDSSGSQFDAKRTLSWHQIAEVSQHGYKGQDFNQYTVYGIGLS